MSTKKLQIVTPIVTSVNGKTGDVTLETVDLDELQASLDNKVPTSRKVNGKALSVDINLSAEDVDAAAASHVGDDTHITAAERTKWNEAATHAASAHAPSDAEKNQNAFSNVKIGQTIVAADNATDTLTLVAGDNVTITPDVTNDTITIAATDTNTTYSAGTGISLNGTQFSNAGVRSIKTGDGDGTISVNTNGTTANVAVKGLKSAAYTDSSAYDKSGAADDALTSAQNYTDNAVAGKADASHTHGADDITSVNASAITGTIAASNLPSYVDDVLEYDNFDKFPTTGESGKIYTDKSTNKIYRWGGSQYVVISDTIALGETESTAYRGDRGKTAYDHSQATGNPHGTTIANISGLQTALDNKISKTGDTFTGALTYNGNRDIAINLNKKGIISGISNAQFTHTNPTDPDNDYGFYIEAGQTAKNSDGYVMGRVQFGGNYSDEDVLLSFIADPIDGNDAATKNYVDTMVKNPIDMTADYEASGASDVPTWATMAKTGDTTKYRIDPGVYLVNGTNEGYGCVTIFAPWDDNNGRAIEWRYHEAEDGFYTYSAYTVISPGQTPSEAICLSSESSGLRIYGDERSIPRYDTSDNDKFLRIVNGSPAWVALTDTSKEGA